MCVVIMEGKVCNLHGIYGDICKVNERKIWYYQGKMLIGFLVHSAVPSWKEVI